MQTFVTLKKFIPIAVAALEVLLFHSRVSQCMSTSTKRRPKTRRSGAKMEVRGSRVWEASRVQSAPCNTKGVKAKSEAKDSNREVSMPCQFGAEQRLQHLANVWKLLKSKLLPFIHALTSVLFSLWLCCLYMHLVCTRLTLGMRTPYW